MQYLLLLPLFLLAACTNDITLPEDAPKAPEAPAEVGFAPVTVTPAKLTSCAGLPNVGNLWKVETTPGGTVQVVGEKNIAVAGIRDNAGVPGFQSYCQDNTLGAVMWPANESFGYIDAYCTSPCSWNSYRQWTVNVYTAYSGTKRVYACATSAPGALQCLGTARDTVWVDDI